MAMRQHFWIVLLSVLGAGQAQGEPARVADFEGRWLVGTHGDPDTRQDGSIPLYIVMEREGTGLKGHFRHIGIELPLLNGVLDGRKVVFDSRFKNEPLNLYFELSADDRYLNAWLSEKPIGVAPYQARRVSPSQLQAAIDQAPKPGPFEKLSLPALRKLPHNGLAATPPMGWNSWNTFRERVSDRLVREMADAMVASGLRDAGYVYLTIDDGWQGHRDAKGVLQPNSKFPDMKALADYVHSKGLKFGLYSSPGPITCAGFVGSHGLEEQDARTFAHWGVDYLKYDWCGAAAVYSTREEMIAVYQKMGEALQRSGRPIVYSICQYGLFEVDSWARAAGGNLWRTGVDSIEGDLWQGILARFEHNGKPENNWPGGWNDADMMLVGHPQLTKEQWRFHFTLWSISASPLILGNDLRAMPSTVREILLNRAVIAIDQDRLGRQGRKVAERGVVEVWSKPLAGGEVAVAMFNRGESPAQAAFEWEEIGLHRPAGARDLWTGAAMDRPDRLRASLPRHGSSMWRVEPTK